MKIGDRVRIAPWCKEPYFIKQAGGRVDGKIVDQAGAACWWVRFGDGYENNYGEEFLELVGNDRMPEPDMDLSEIEAAQRIYEELK